MKTLYLSAKRISSSPTTRLNLADDDQISLENDHYMPATNCNL